MKNPKHHRGLKRIRTPACEGKEPNQAEEDRQSSNSFGIDEALFGPSVGISIAVKIGADDACDNTCADEFGEAKCHRHKTGYDRHVEDRGEGQWEEMWYDKKCWRASDDSSVWWALSRTFFVVKDSWADLEIE